MGECGNQKCQPQCQRCRYNHKRNGNSRPQPALIPLPIIRKLLKPSSEKMYDWRKQVRQRKTQRQWHEDDSKPVQAGTQCQRDLVQIVPDPDQDEDHNNRKNHIE